MNVMKNGKTYDLSYAKKVMLVVSSFPSSSCTLRRC